MPATHQRFRYSGGPQKITVTLPDRSVALAAGDTIDVSAAEAKLLADHPDFTPVKRARATTSSEED